MGKTSEMQRLIRHYRDETGEEAVDMKKVAKWAAGKGWPMPRPADPIELLAKEFSKAARQETKKDKVTGRSYRVNHSFTVTQGGQQLHLWIDIDNASHGPMLKSVTNRREQMVGDGLHLLNDVEHWNRINPDQKQIELDLDLTLDVEWRRNSDEDEEDAA
ncbi:MAG: hypothetical protein JJ917_17775 [Rhizobiales bacterium]|jgi:hypothetical protein|nr:hypothetical protein [Hyphomicrobiales bacterium]MBO6722834.1 hypothetical protein [Roseitalea sp.]